MPRGELVRMRVGGLVTRNKTEKNNSLRRNNTFFISYPVDILGPISVADVKKASPPAQFSFATNRPALSL